MVVLGPVQIVVRVDLWVKNQFARWIGVLVAVVNAIASVTA